jgi:hypothetical protein
MVLKYAGGAHDALRSNKHRRGFSGFCEMGGVPSSVTTQALAGTAKLYPCPHHAPLERLAKAHDCRLERQLVELPRNPGVQIPSAEGKLRTNVLKHIHAVYIGNEVFCLRIDPLGVFEFAFLHRDPFLVRPDVLNEGPALQVRPISVGVLTHGRDLARSTIVVNRNLVLEHLPGLAHGGGGCVLIQHQHSDLRNALQDGSPAGPLPGYRRP